MQDHPSPEYPGLHLQLWDPLVLVHRALALQVRSPTTHSSSSESKLNV